MNRWENSSYYARTFSPLLQAPLPRVARFDFTAAQILTLNTIPITIFPPITGFLYYTNWGMFYKNQGEVFTGGAGKTISVNWLNSPTFTTAVTFLGAQLELARGASFQNPFTAAAAADDAATSLGSKGMRLTISGGNPGGVGSACSLVVGYYLIPTYIEFAGGPSTPLP